LDSSMETAGCPLSPWAPANAVIPSNNAVLTTVHPHPTPIYQTYS
jgi:hypothetical protein